MRFFRDLGTGLVSYYRSFEFIFTNNLWYFFFFPALIAVGLYFSGDAIRQDVYNGSDLRSLAPDDYNQWLMLGLKAVFVFVAFRLNKVVLIIVLSPVLALLSAKTEKLIAGNSYPFSFAQFLKDINRGISIAVRNGIIQLLIISIWLTTCVFIGGMIEYTTWFIFVIGFYFYGFSMMDYINERRKVSMEESIVFIRKHAGLTIMVGAIFSGLFLIPFAGVIIAPVTGIVAATLGVDKIVDLKKRYYSEEKKPLI